MSSDRSKYNAEKEAKFRELLKNGGNAWIFFDPKYHGVIVPAAQRQSKVCVLQWGTRMAVPVRHFVVSQEAVSGALTFKGVWEMCFIPWEAIDRMQGDYGTGDTWFSHGGNPTVTFEPEGAKIINLNAWKIAKAMKG